MCSVCLCSMCRLQRWHLWGESRGCLVQDTIVLSPTDMPQHRAEPISQGTPQKGQSTPDKCRRWGKEAERKKMRKSRENTMSRLRCSTVKQIPTLQPVGNPDNTKKRSHTYHNPLFTIHREPFDVDEGGSASGKPELRKETRCLLISFKKYEKKILIIIY